MRLHREDEHPSHDRRDLVRYAREGVLLCVPFSSLQAFQTKPDSFSPSLTSALPHMQPPSNCTVILLLLSLLSELPLPPLLYTPLQSFWTYLFPPFGANFGVGVLGALQCFLGSNLLSKNVEEWVQVGGWILFLVGILNLLAVRLSLPSFLSVSGADDVEETQGLAFGRRLNPIRSFSADSTSPSALRKLRLASSSGTSPSSPANSSASQLPPSSSYVQFDEPEMEEGPSFRPIKSAMKPPGKRTLSRNGANGIVISPPRPLRPISSHSEGEEQLTDVHREREREMARGKTVSPPPPVYFTAARE